MGTAFRSLFIRKPQNFLISGARGPWQAHL